ncbi:hypothetical protein ABZ371_15815 [Streptomyces sp. NPDC005899]|uniref:hypothetical protein n=1 Tax=Streptomyces sp. NPDC005899 TaxID=3155716 RepID=UPI0033F05CCC
MGREATYAARGLNLAALSDEALLRRIAAEPKIEAYLACDGEFDLTRTDPIESIALPAGLPVEPVAGCNAGGTHYLCGPADSDRVRPVLYTDSEGQASLIAESLAEALTLAIVLPSWHDALAGFRPPALNADYLEDNPDHPEVRDRLLAALRPPSPRSWPASSPRPPAPSRTASSLRSRARRTRPSNRCSVCRPSRTAPPRAAFRTRRTATAKP